MKKKNLSPKQLIVKKLAITLLEPREAPASGTTASNLRPC